MSYLVVGFLVKLLDIPGAVIGLIGGWHAKRWLHIALTAFIGGSAGEVTLFVLKDTRAFSVIVWLVGVAACFTWAVFAYWIRSRLSKSN